MLHQFEFVKIFEGFEKHSLEIISQTNEKFFLFDLESVKRSKMELIGCGKKMGKSWCLP